MAAVRHLPYQIDLTTKYAHYEMLWKLTCLDLINRHIAEERRAGTRVLDVGSGRGEMMQLLAEQGYRVEGFDADPVCIELSSKHGICQRGNIADIASHYPGKLFDIVVSLHVIEHLENPQKSIEQLMRLSSQYLVLATPNLSSFPFLNLSRNIASCNAGHVCGWNYSHLTNLLQNILHLEIVEWAVDCVRLYDYLPYLGWLDNLLHRSGLRAQFEERILTRIFPNLSNSLIVLARVPS
ncbi:MAG: class I SAM-dependent methyltransferase [Anaerolineales bacterium]